MAGDGQDGVVGEGRQLAKSGSPGTHTDEEASSSLQVKEPRSVHDEDDQVEEQPQPFNAKSLVPAKKRQRSTSPGPEERRPKRPGTRARITAAAREQIRQRAAERERESALFQQQKVQTEGSRTGINDVVREHYNAVPERGRDWRKTDSQIKGLRSFNNWVKSCVIQKFAPDEDHAPGARERGISSGNELLVLDMGCGKGGDLGKWQQSTQAVALYVGLDHADVSIEQAKDRYYNMSNPRGGGGRGGRDGRGGRGGHNNRRPPSRIFEARFQVKDCYAESIGDVDIVRQVGFSKSNIADNRGFDVVSMMFCMHYAFETETKARQMLMNVAGALKKGGRFIGTIPSSDVIGSRVREFHEKANERQRAKAEETKKTENGEPAAPTEDGELEEGETEDVPETAEWGNDIYRVRFPGKTPEDGIFRPPFGWKYSFFMSEAVEEVPEYVVPWEAFRALAEDYNLELQYHKNFSLVWETEKNDEDFRVLSERMGVRDRHTGKLAVTPEEMEAASFYVAFCFYKV